MKRIALIHSLLLALCVPLAATANTVPATATATATATAPTLSLQGTLEQGALIIGRTSPSAQVTLGARRLRVAADGTFAFGLDRDAPEAITLSIVDASGAALNKTLRITPRTYQIQRVTGISKKIMNPTTTDLARVTAENAQVAKARKLDDDRLDFLQSFIWPADGPITGVFGSQRYYNGEPKRPHYGVDVGIPTGTPVKAPAGGLVTLAHPDMFYSGGTLIIDHGHGISSTLMHLSEILVKAGDTVTQGQLVAKSGASGRATGPHLDWRMNWFDERIDAQKLVPAR